jgi:hypothetical protein
MRVQAKYLLLPFKATINKSGANYSQVSKLIDLKLMLDNRRKLPNSGKKAEPKNSIVKQSLSFVLVGAILCLLLHNSTDPYLFFFMFHTMLLVMNSLTMLAEYSVSLFDPRENNTLLPLPVNGQTMGWARVMHIFIYLSVLSLGLMLPGVILSIFKFGGITSFIFFISVFFNSLFTLFITVYIYLALIKLMDGEKLKDTMMYAQVVMTIAIIVSYQFIPDYLMPENGKMVSLQPEWFFIFIPPAWFAALSNIFESPTLINSTLTVIGFVIPAASISFLGKKMFYGFNEGLIKMNSQSSKKASKTNEKTNASLWFTISRYIAGINQHEYPVFKIIWKISGRERMFKQALLPILAYIVVIPAISIFFTGNMEQVETTYVTFLYFTIMSSSMLPTLLTIGNSKNAHWIFYSLPNIRPDVLFKAAIKVGLTKFYLPAYLLISLPLIYFKGLGGVLDIVTIFIFNCLIAFMFQYIQTPHLFFTREKSASQGGATVLKMLLAMFAGIPLGFLHAHLAEKNPWFVLFFTATYILLLLLITKIGFSKRYTWKYVKNANNTF